MMRGALPINEHLEIPASDLSWSFSRSGGPGGQHVNTTDTRARLHFALSTCEVLHGAAKRRLREAHPSWETTSGDLVISSDAYRSRQRNVDQVRERLAAAIRAALVPPRQRKKTRPTRASRRQRVKDKRSRGKLKQSRRRPTGNDD